MCSPLISVQTNLEKTTFNKSYTHLKSFRIHRFRPGFLNCAPPGSSVLHGPGLGFPFAPPHGTVRDRY